MEDIRKTRLRKGLAQLSKEQISKLLEAPEESLVMDEFYYHDGLW